MLEKAKDHLAQAGAMADRPLTPGELSRLQTLADGGYASAQTFHTAVRR